VKRKKDEIGNNKSQWHEDQWEKPRRGKNNGTTNGRQERIHTLHSPRPHSPNAWCSCHPTTMSFPWCSVHAVIQSGSSVWDRLGSPPPPNLFFENGIGATVSSISRGLPDLTRPQTHARIPRVKPCAHIWRTFLDTIGTQDMPHRLECDSRGSLQYHMKCVGGIKTELIYTRQQVQFGCNYLDSELVEVSHVSSEAAGAYNGIALSG
jgi:hypothetical protein